MAAQTTSPIKRVTSSEVPEPAPGTWSNCLVVNGVAYVAGMIARGKDGKIVDGDEYEQAKADLCRDPQPGRGGGRQHG